VVSGPWYKESPVTSPSGKGTLGWAYLKLVLGFALLGAVLIFTFQNTDVVRMRFLGWVLELSLSLLIFLTLALGFLSGFLMTGLRHWRRRRKGADL